MSVGAVQITPKCVAMFPFVTKPCTLFHKEGKFKITCLFDPKDEEHKAFLLRLNKALSEAEADEKTKFKNKPWSVHLEPDTKASTELLEVQFKSSYAPRVFDAAGNKILGDLNVGNGSVVKVGYKTAPYTGFGGGITCYFEAIQIIDFVEYTGGEASDYGFEQEEGFNADSRLEDHMNPEPQAADFDPEALPTGAPLIDAQTKQEELDESIPF